MYLADLGHPVGHEAGQRRPVLLMSATNFHHYRMSVVLPITRTRRGYPSHVEIDGVLPQTSYVQCEQPRTLSTERLITYLGPIDGVDMLKVEHALKQVLALN